MQLSDEERKKIYEEEKAKEDAGKKKSDQKNLVLGCGFFAFLGIFIIIIALSGRSCNETQKSIPTSSNSIETQKPVPTSSSSISRGSTVIIQTSEGSVLPLATTKEAYKEMWKYWRADDKVGMTQMVLAGNMFMVDSGTKALVIDRAVYEYEVRIQSGEYEGKSGWIDINFVKTSN